MAGYASAAVWLRSGAPETVTEPQGFSYPFPLLRPSAEPDNTTPNGFGSPAIWLRSGAPEAITPSGGFTSPSIIFGRGAYVPVSIEGEVTATFAGLDSTLTGSATTDSESIGSVHVSFRTLGAMIEGKLDDIIAGTIRGTFSGFNVSSGADILEFPVLIDREATRPVIPEIKPIPAIPPVPNEVGQQTYEFLTALREASQVHFGQTRNFLDSSVTFRDLKEIGLVEADNATGTASVSEQLGGLISSETGGSGSGGTPVLRDISGVEFRVNVTGVIISWSLVTGIDADAIAYLEVWRVGPFDLIDDDYPVMAIEDDGSGGASVTWVDPLNALDGDGNQLPTPVVALAGISDGTLFTEPLELGRVYQYFVRYRGVDGTPSAWHNLNGTRVEAVVDYLALLEAFENQIGLVHLDSALKTSIGRIDTNTGELLRLEDLLADQIAAVSTAILNEADARRAAITAEQNARATRVQDIFDYIAAKYAATNTIVESRGLIQDAEISRIELAYQDADAALAAQVQTLIATTGGKWFVQPAEPTVDNTWTGTYHWVDTDGANRHYVSTDDSRDPNNGATSGNNWGGWLDVTDTRIAANAAAVITETNARVDADNAIAQDITNLTGQINNPSTGLSAVSNAIDALDTFVRDQGASGFLAGATRFTSLQAQVNQNVTNITAGVTARQALEAYLADNGPDGYIQRTLFGTQLGTDLADSISGNYATQSSIDALETYIKDEGPSGFLAESSQFTNLKQDVTSALSGVSSNTTAVNDLSIYLNDQGPGGFLQSATRFTNLEANYDSLVADTAANTTAINTLDVYVRDDGPTGLLAQSQQILNLQASIDTNTASISSVSSALTTETQARVNETRELRTALGDPNDPTSSAIYQEAASLFSDLEGRMAGRYYSAIDVNGRVTGFEFYDNNGNLQDAGSAFKIYTDNFVVENTTGQRPLEMTSNVFKLNLDVIQLNGFIPSANIGSIDVGSLSGNTAQFISANIGAGTITSAMIANEIFSQNWSLGAGRGWHIDSRTGRGTFNDLYARGNIEASSLRANTAMVGTLNVNGNAITANQIASGALVRANPGSFTTIYTRTFNFTDNLERAIVTLTGSIGNGSGDNYWCDLSAMGAGVTSAILEGPQIYPFTITKAVPVSGRSLTVTLTGRTRDIPGIGGSLGYANVWVSTCTVMGAKR